MSYFPKQAVLVPFDFSDMSVEAVNVALNTAVSPAHVHVLHVLPEMEVNEPGVVWGRVDDQSRKRHAEEAIRKRLSGPQYEGIQVAVVIGDPGHEIAEYADRHKMDLIIVPSHGRTGWRRVLIGSVAERVVRLANCPVLVLRQPQPQK